MEWNLQDWANLSTIITACVAVVALVGAIWQVLVTRTSQREAMTSELYGNYLALAVANPVLASGYVSTPQGSGKVDEEFERYEWFVS